jgi:hypothetical protein
MGQSVPNLAVQKAAKTRSTGTIIAYMINQGVMHLALGEKFAREERIMNDQSVLDGGR